jgi:hypothetical protein
MYYAHDCDVKISTNSTKFVLWTDNNNISNVIINAWFNKKNVCEFISRYCLHEFHVYPCI